MGSGHGNKRKCVATASLLQGICKPDCMAWVLQAVQTKYNLYSHLICARTARNFYGIFWKKLVKLCLSIWMSNRSWTSEPLVIEPRTDRTSAKSDEPGEPLGFGSKFKHHYFQCLESKTIVFTSLVHWCFHLRFRNFVCLQHISQYVIPHITFKRYH